MNKQDRHGARTPEDVVRRFKDIPQGVEAAQKAASNAFRAAEEANKAAENANRVAAEAVSQAEFDAAMQVLSKSMSDFNTAMDGVSREIERLSNSLTDFDSEMERVSQEIETIQQNIGTGEVTELYGGKKMVGESWNTMTAKHRYLYTFRSITGGIEFTEVNGDIHLTATAPGEATVTIAANDGSAIDRWTYIIE